MEVSRGVSRIEQIQRTEQGDIAKSLQGMVKAHFISRETKDIWASTRLSRYEITILALQYISERISYINSLSESDVESAKADDLLSNEEKKDVSTMWELKKRFMRNPHALAYTQHYAFRYAYIIGLQSLDGLSREEGVTMVGGAYRRILDKDEMGFFGRLKRRISGNVLYPQ